MQNNTFYIKNKKIFMVTKTAKGPSQNSHYDEWHLDIFY